jgi:hypothetical protein
VPRRARPDLVAEHAPVGGRAETEEHGLDERFDDAA